MNGPFRPYKLSPAFSAKAAIARGIAEIGGPQAIVARMKRRRSVAMPMPTPTIPRMPRSTWSAGSWKPARAPLEHLAALAGGFFQTTRTPASTFAALAARAARGRGALEADVLEALADGVIDGGERRALADALGEQISALATARARLLDLENEGGDPA